MKTKIERRLTVLCKLVMLLVLTGFSEIFTARAPNWRSDDKLEKQAKKDYYEASKSDFQIAYLLGVIRFSENFPVKAQKCDYYGKHQITRWKRWFRGVWQNFGNRLLLRHNGVKWQFHGKSLKVSFWWKALEHWSSKEQWFWSGWQYFPNWPSYES